MPRIIPLFIPCLFLATSIFSNSGENRSNINLQASISDGLASEISRKEATKLEYEIKKLKAEILSLPDSWYTGAIIKYGSIFILLAGLAATWWNIRQEMRKFQKQRGKETFFAILENLGSERMTSQINAAAIMPVLLDNKDTESLKSTLLILLWNLRVRENGSSRKSMRPIWINNLGIVLSKISMLKKHERGVFQEMNLVFSGLHLSGFKPNIFDKRCFNRTYFSGATLLNATFKKAILDDVDFRGAMLKDVNFKDANLVRTKFHRSKLSGVQFEDADLRFAQFTKAELRNVNFKGAVLHGANFRALRVSDFNEHTLQSMLKSLSWEYAELEKEIVIVLLKMERQHVKNAKEMLDHLDEQLNRQPLRSKKVTSALIKEHMIELSKREKDFKEREARLSIKYQL